jgi:DNA modification methylase
MSKTPRTVAGLVVKRVPIGSLHADPGNVNKHPERNLEAIRKSIETFGQVEPLVVQAGTGRVIGGNGRLEVFKRAGFTEVDIVEIELTDQKARALGVALNRTAALAEMDEDALAQLLKSLPTDLQVAAGFDASEIETLLQSIGELEVQEPEVPAPPDEPITKRGDLIILGNHRLLCGDSCSAAELDILLDGAHVSLVNTDPPYNVAVEPRSNNAIAAGLSSFSASQRKHPSAGDQQSADLQRYPEKSKPTHKKMRAKDRPLANDFVSDEQFDVLLDGWFGNIARVLKPGGAFYIWGGYANCANYPPVLKRHGLYFSQAIIWHKMHPVLTRKDFMGDHEWCFYGWREGAGHNFYGPANVPDVWQVKKVNPQSMVHLTEKPVELAARAMVYSSKEGEAVLDLFGGSGSTMMAAEQTKRRAFSMELDPAYCDVICERFQKATGIEPERRPGKRPATSVVVPAAPTAEKPKRKRKAAAGDRAAA